MGSRQTADFLTANFIDSVEQMADQMKSVEDESGLWEMFADGLCVRGPHVATDGSERAAPFAVEPAEEGIERFFPPVFADPNQAMSFQIVNQSEIAVPALAADFIDADDVE